MCEDRRVEISRGIACRQSTVPLFGGLPEHQPAGCASQAGILDGGIFSKRALPGTGSKNCGFLSTMRSDITTSKALLDQVTRARVPCAHDGGGVVFSGVLLFGCSFFQPVTFGGHALLEKSFLGDRPFQSHGLSGIKGKWILIVGLGGLLATSGRILIEIGLSEPRLDPLPLRTATA